MTVDEEIGKYLKRLRGKTPAWKYAQMFGVTRAHLMNIEAGRKTLQDDMIEVLVEKFPDLSLSGEGDLAAILKLKDYSYLRIVRLAFKQSAVKRKGHLLEYYAPTPLDKEVTQMYNKWQLRWNTLGRETKKRFKVKRK
jgi:hypothetical protein